MANNVSSSNLNSPLFSPLANPLMDSLRDLSAWLEAEKIPYAIIGGVAVAIVAQPRMTKDIDVAISLDPGRLESFLETASAYNLGPRISDAADFARRQQVVLLQHQPTGINVDLTLAAIEFDYELIARARTGPMNLKVATSEDLIITKAVAHRPRDVADIESILNIEQNVDLERIRHWVGQFAQSLEMPELLEDLEKLLRR